MRSNKPEAKITKMENQEGIMYMFIVIVCALLVPLIIYITTLQATLNEVSLENRKMPSGQVWLLLIPIFGIVWHFIVVSRMADSLSSEFASRGITPDDPRPGYTIGLVMNILLLCGIIPLIGVLASIGGLICWIIYWVKISGYKNQLSALKNIL